VADTQKYGPPRTGKGEEAHAARSRLARHLLTALGASEETATAGAAEASEDAQFLDDIVTSLVDDGLVSLARMPERRATEADLDRTLLGPAFSGALDRRRGLPAGPRERARLGRLYALAGETEKAASCIREVLDEKGPIPLVLVLEVAEIAAKAGEKALALGAVDRIAEVVLTGDAGKDGRLEDVALAGGALERARDVCLALDAAPRAVALARAAVLLYERSGLKREAARGLDGLGRAQVAAGERPQARSTFERRRALAVAQGEPLLAARSLELAAGAFLATGDAEAAVDRLEQASDAYGASGDRRAACSAGLRAAELRISRGDLTVAASTLSSARAHAVSCGDSKLEAATRVALARSRLAEGQLGPALKEAEAAAFELEQRSDPKAAAEARVVRAQALLAAGSPAEAAAELALAQEAVAGAAAARSIELRAELRLAEGRADEAYALLADAGRVHAAEHREIEALRTQLRRGEVALGLGDAKGAAARLALIASSATTSSEAPELVARVALLEAAVATEDAARRSALDRAFDLAYATDHHGPRIAAGVARAHSRLALGKPAVAAADVRAALEGIRDARASLPEERRAAYLATPLARDAYTAGKTIRDALEKLKAERGKASDDETAGIETGLNALDLLLGGLAPAS
jgi:hypothetical protein